MRVNWQDLWDELYRRIKTKNSWGKNEVLSLMDEIEKKELRRVSLLGDGSAFLRSQSAGGSSSGGDSLHSLEPQCESGTTPLIRAGQSNE